MTLPTQGESSYTDTLPLDKGDDFGVSSSIFKYTSILDIPLSAKVIDSLGKYFAKVNSSTAGINIFGYIFSAIFCIQIIGPALLINAVDIWPSDSIITKIFRIICCFCDGPSIGHADQRLYLSLALSLLYLMSFLLICIRSYYFSKMQILATKEAICIYIYFANILVLLLPLLLSGFPRAFYKASHDEDTALSIAVIILVLISYIISISTMFFFIFPRVLLENIPLHGWISTLIVLPYISTNVSAMLSSSISFLPGIWRAIIPSLIFLLYAAIGSIIFVGNIYIKSCYSLFFGMIHYSASIISFIQIFNICFQKITPEILIIVLCLLIILFSILLKMINTKRISSIIFFYDENMETTNLRSVLDIHYKSSLQFVNEMLLMTEYWHPLFSSWKLFDYAISRWPQSFIIQLFYSRLLSLYPSMNPIMVHMSSQKLESLSWFSSFISTQCARQFSHISQTRQTSMTKKINSKLKKVKNKTHALFSHLRKFWTDILQKNISRFWDDADKATAQILEIDSMLRQLTKDYPNSSDVWESYRTFLINVKHDLKAASEIRNKISIIEQSGRQQPDRSMKLALQIFPNIQPSLQDCRDISLFSDSKTVADDISIHSSPYKNYINTDLANDEAQESSSPHETNKGSSQETDLHIEIATQELIEHTKFGSSSTNIVFCVIMTIALIVVFVLYSLKYTSKLVDRQNGILSFMKSFCLFYYHMANYNLLFMTLPLFQSNTIKVDRSLMQSVAPNLYTSAKMIPIWKVDQDLIDNTIINVREFYSSTIQNVYELDDSDGTVSEIINLIDYDVVFQGNNLQTSVEQILTTIETLIKFPVHEFYRLLDEMDFYDILNATYQQLDKIYERTVFYSMTNYDNGLNEINQFMVLSIIMSLFFITIPFVLKLYTLSLQGEAISNSFLYFPNNENRRIITKYGSQTSFDNDSPYLAILAKKRTQRPFYLIQLAIVFLFSFIPTIIGCFVIKYLAADFVSDADFTTVSISTLHMPFTFLILSMESVLRACISNQIDIISSISDKKTYQISVYQNSLDYLESAISFFSNGMWSNVCSINLYLTRSDRNGTINLYNNFFEQKANVRPKTLFEILVTNELPYSVDLIIGSLHNFIALQAVSADAIQTNDPEFLSLLFWFTNFSSINRNLPYFELVESNTNLYLNKYKSQAVRLIITVVILQVFACFLINLMYVVRSKRIKNALRFYQDISLPILMQNKSAINLLNTGKGGNDKMLTQFTNSEWIVMNMPQCVFVANRDLIITDYNKSFYDLVQMNFNFTHVDIPIRNEPLTQVIRVMNTTEDDLVSINGEISWRIFVQHLTEVLASQRGPQLSEAVTLTISEDSVLHFLVNAIALSEQMPVRDGDSHTIDSIAVVFENVTNEYQDILQLKQENEDLNKMLYTVLPEPAIRSLLKSTDGSYSFGSPYVTIGLISIDYVRSTDSTTDPVLKHRDFLENLFYIKDFNIVEIEKTLSSYNTIFTKLDEIIQDSQFGCLLKIKTVGNVYMFGAGFFDNSLRPEKCADQACRFILKVLSQLETVVKSINPTIVLRCGIHSDGPSVSGVVSITNPFIQVISPATERAAKLLVSAEPFRANISRNVYEMIFTSGFHVSEKDSITMPDSTTIQVFELNPQ